MADDLHSDPKPAESLGEIGLFHFAPYLMNRIMGRYNADVQTSLKQQGLTTVKVRTLGVLTVVPGLTIKELAVYAVTEQSTLSRALESLEAAGFVRRQEREGDRRLREIHLTEAGRQEFEKHWQLLYARYQTMFDDVGEDERAQFVATLQKVLKNTRLHDF